MTPRPENDGSSIIAGAGLHLQYNKANSWEAINMLNFMIHSISDDIY